MSKSKIWLSSPHMGGTELEYIQEAFDTNWIAPEGTNISEFEQDLENYLSQNLFVTALSSATAAIHLGLILLNVKPNDVVICQSLTFSASANPILYLGATPVFVDSEPETWNLCPIALEEAILDTISKGQKPKAIITVHLYGVPYKIEEIRAVANKYKIPILEDSAEALGSGYKGQKCGTFGDISVFSFNGNKIITTSGGGAIITSNYQLKQKIQFLASQAKDKAPHYQHSELGYNYQMSNICAGIGRGQMKVLDKHITLRRAMHDFYVSLFENIPGITVFTTADPDSFANYWLTSILVNPNETKNGINRETIRLALLDSNIECRPLWKPMHLQPLYKNYPFYGTKIAETLFEKGLSLPSGSNLTDLDRDRIKMAFIKLLE
ncbi:DegT/DnrJ/EryC1/StrS family aminotransferase [Flavobacterium gilvum]|uniref:Pyridoxal phosphate-dependent aminotransferase n=1 Tax=Flavobacterium gilvum TaxID=1492737 RepID=A0AAC9I5T8_9FLAO|nr:aminotransferase class I/II-fold pyridoxal phosphate-dependent enzyme [Flavobacterium gilvum]AOW10969.1 pyridoxal phosphate-dependent aminotransferase [Flavobacterium gilvum]KFC60746.1 4-keto-6-deoxy-N-Acetyl-D-hexosaminyl-(Lipid carrier) aminotransferase [Flavobacterium gilvum]